MQILLAAKEEANLKTAQKQKTKKLNYLQMSYRIKTYLRELKANLANSSILQLKIRANIK